MAKGLLRFFGVLSVLIGFVAIGIGVLFWPPNFTFVFIVWGCGMLIAGAPLLGFAYALELLEDIARNTRARPAGE